MSREEILVVVASIQLGLVAWFLRRLVVSVDEFKTWVRGEIEEHGEELARIGERHRLEDQAGSSAAAPRGRRQRG